MVVAILVTFWLYLRPTETMSIRCKDVFEPTGSSRGVVVNLHPAEKGDPSKVGLMDETHHLTRPHRLSWLVLSTGALALRVR